MIVSGAAPPMVDGLRRVRRCMSRRVFAVSAMRARECRLYSALSIIAPSVNVPRRTRRKPSTIRGAAPDVVIEQPTAARAGAHPYPHQSYHSYSLYQRFNSYRNKGLRVSPSLERFLNRSDDELSMQVHDLQTSY